MGVVEARIVKPYGIGFEFLHVKIDQFTF